MFTQGVAVLTRTPVSIEDLVTLLPEYPAIRHLPASEIWEMGGPSIVVSYRPEVNGHVIIDTVSHPWPDHMGSPKEEPMLFGAWSMGHFGPFAYPNGLERAQEQSWGWSEARETVSKHTSFLRVRISYVLGGSPETLVMPEDYQPQHELDFIIGILRCILRHPAALCYFNPSGEVLASADMIADSVRFHTEHELPTLDLWTNVRLFNLESQWLLMDSVGNWQLEMPDHEAPFPKDRFDPREVSQFIRKASSYILKQGDVIKNCDTMDGPGAVRWKAVKFEEPVTSPPRKIFCWMPADVAEIPSQIIDRKLCEPEASTPSPKQSRWWQRWLKK
jgi:hypothetical protein